MAVGLFGRKRTAQSGPTEDLEELESAVGGGAPEPVVDSDADPLADEPTAEREVAERRFSRLRGPFDVDEVDSREGYLDLGALLVPAVAGMDLRLEIDEGSQTIVAAQVASGPSSMQLQVYAAPRTVGIWPEIRTEIAQGVTGQRGRAEVVDGSFGSELRASLPGGQAMRFVGIDGPRWFLRAVLSGPAASHESAAQPLYEVLRQCVVVRGSQAMAPRELLALRLPPEVGLVSEGAEPGEADDLRPFERGPEITEVR